MLSSNLVHKFNFLIYPPLNTHVSVNNTTIYFIYNKNSILSGRHVSAFAGSPSGPLKNRSKNYLYFNALRDPKYLKCRQFLDLFLRGPEDDPVKVETCHPDNILFLLYIK